MMRVHLSGSARWLVLLTVVVMTSLGCAHTHAPERRMYLIAEDASRIDFQEDARGVGGAGAEAYCNELQKQCHTLCMRRKPEIPSIPKHSGKHKEHCTTKCLDEFMDCVKKMEEVESQELQSRKLQFPSMNTALDWLKEHTPEAPPETHVVVAGVGFWRLEEITFPFQLLLQ